MGDEAPDRTSGDLINTPFFNPPQSLLDLTDEYTPLAKLNAPMSVIELHSLDQEIAPKKKGGTLSRLRLNRGRSVSELPRPSWDVFNNQSSSMELPQPQAEPEESEFNFSEGVPVDISVLSLAAAAAVSEDQAEADLSPMDGKSTWKKLTIKTLGGNRRKSIKSTFGSAEDTTSKLTTMLSMQRVPESIVTKLENGRKLILEGSTDDLAKLLGMQMNTEVQGDFVDVFLCTFRNFMTPAEVLEVLMRSHREACLDLTQEEAATMDKATIVEWNESVEKNILNVLTKWYINHQIDFVNDMELDLRLRDFVRSDVFEVTTKVNIPNIVEKLDKAKENYENWQRDIKLMIQYRNAIEKNGAQLMRKTSTKNIFDLNVTAAVKALCILEMDIFQKIPSWEFSSLAWMSKKCEQDAPLLFEHITFFNKVSNWVATEVVLTGNLDMRANLIERFITMARQAREWNNFNSCFQIVLGLHNPAVLKLKSTWSKVGRKYVAALKEVNELVNPEKNHRNYRSLLSRTNPPCIPYVGMYLKDLLFASDGSKSILPNGNVNFGKMNTIGMTMLAIRRFQATPYPFDDDTLVYWFKQNTFAMSDDDLLVAAKKLIESSEV